MIVTALVAYLASLLVRDEWFRDTFRFTVQGLAAALLILVPFFPGGGRIRAAFISASCSRAVASLGLASYSIYLVHFTVIRRLDPFMPTALPSLLTAVLLSGAAVALGLLLYRWIEVPVLAWRKRVESAAKLESDSD